MQGLIIFLMIVIVVLGIIIVLCFRKINYDRIALGNMSGMIIMQRMFELMASSIPAANKIEELNKIIIDVFSAEYSSICLYDGISHEVKASNVEETFKSSIKDLADEQTFKNNVAQNISKYMMTTGNRMLAYKSAMERKVKSAMFSPIYYNGMYIGFWIMEDKAEAAYDNISKEELARLKDNIGVFIENVTSQESIENAHNTDKQTGFYNNIYLYSTVRKKTAAVEDSTIVLMQFMNLPDINDKYGREIGDRLIARASKALLDMMSKEAILIRHSGGKFCIVSPGATPDMMHPQMERYLSTLKVQEEMVDDEKVAFETNIVIHNIKKQSNLDKEIMKMSSYIDGMEQTNTIKII